MYLEAALRMKDHHDIIAAHAEINLVFCSRTNLYIRIHSKK